MKKVPCEYCYGDGVIEINPGSNPQNAKQIKCPVCGGKGECWPEDNDYAADKTIREIEQDIYSAYMEHKYEQMRDDG